MLRKDFHLLAETRIADAKALLKAKRYDAAYYLAGYAVECSLKACISKLTRRYQFPLKETRSVYTHDFNQLLKAARLTDDFDREKKRDSQLEAHWDVIKDWTEESRYNRKGSEGRQLATNMIAAVADPVHGVLQCIKKYW